MPTNLIATARSTAGLTQAELAGRAGTSRPTLSAYERGQKSPSLEVATRIVAAAGFDLALEPRLSFDEVARPRGRPIAVPSDLPRLPLDRAFAVVELPLHLNWSRPGAKYDLRDRRQRGRVYEVVLREGGPADVLAYVDGALLVDLWNDLVLPVEVRAAWDDVVAASGDGRAA